MHSTDISKMNPNAKMRIWSVLNGASFTCLLNQNERDVAQSILSERTKNPTFIPDALKPCYW